MFAPSRLESVTGQDGVSSIPFSDDLWLWTFGDTIIKNRDGSETMPANSLAFTSAPDRNTVRDLHFTYYRENGRIAQFIKNSPGEDPKHHRLWALDGVRLGDTVYVYYLHIIVHSQKAFDFSLQSVGIARWDIPPGWKVGDPVNFSRQDHLFQGKGPAFGASVLSMDGYLYITGQYNTGFIQSPVQIARVPENKITSHDAYNYLSSDGTWSDRSEKACGLMGDVAGECSLSYNPYSEKFILVYCRLFSRDIIMAASNDLKGMAKAEKRVIYSTKADNSKNDIWYYSAKEIFMDRDRMFMIYINSKEYQPYLIEISIPSLMKKS